MAYFEKLSAAKPFLKIVKAIIKSELSVLVESSDLTGEHVHVCVGVN